MKYSQLVVSAALLLPTGLAFTSHSFPMTHTGVAFATRVRTQGYHHAGARLYAATEGNSASVDNKDAEIDRLKSMAAKLRAEAAALEASQKQQMAEATQKAFDKFDTDRDGQISLDELKAGLEKVLKTELPERQVAKLMQNFDASGDGALQLSEFVTIDQLRNKLAAIARDEKAGALEATKLAKQEEEAVKFIQAKMELINDRPPTTRDKIISILPYLFPLMDGLTYGRFLVLENLDNPLTVGLGIVYALYRSIPFSGFIAFFALSSLSGNPTINRLIRFNMQQAIFLDLALFFPGLIAGLYGLIASGSGFQLPPMAAELGSNALFLTLLAAIGYASISSLLGQVPDKIPIISKATSDRMPTVDMFDAFGRFKPEDQSSDGKDQDKKD